MNFIEDLGPTVVALIAGLAGLYKYFTEKNKEIYEKRLNEVYASLYAFLVTQETYRQLYMEDTYIRQSPILTSERTKVKQYINLSKGTCKVEKEVKVDVLDRQNFINMLNETNAGLARPDLLIAIKQYELIVSLDEKGEKCEKLTDKKVEIEYKLFRAIVDGYEETIYALGLKGKETVLDLERVKI